MAWERLVFNAGAVTGTDAKRLMQTVQHPDPGTPGSVWSVSIAPSCLLSLARIEDCCVPRLVSAGEGSPPVSAAAGRGDETSGTAELRL